MHVDKVFYTKVLMHRPLSLSGFAEDSEVV